MAETNLVVDKVSPWSAMRITAATGFIGFLVWLAAVGLLYLLLSGMGLLAPISELIGGEDSIGAGLVLGLAAAVGALWWVLSIGFMALGAVIYNACGGLVGGLKISLADDS
ncbi:DUF3566 domain-containing protein [uncultured Corynebacterium sp.]|uniref:DUF3566 domain-containing protein n=1 Tax=uncultured Corynebacterium sp. TaxID=159447 RepID=UPI0026240366|nr:DUF3566 domain-containing protein [uncultured Corynebacterium sp.]